MAFDATLADRLRPRLQSHKGFAEKRMFGGIAFLLNGNMCCGVHGDSMIVRLDPAETGKALRSKHTRVFDLTGRPMKGWILVDAKGLANDADLGKWTDVAVGYAASLPPK
jgi:hypothetical protein